MVESSASGRDHSNAPASFHFAAGLSTGLLSAALLQPADLLKTRVQQSQSANLRNVLREITAGPQALRSLWRGMLPSIIRTGFGSAVYLTTLNALRRAVARPAAATATARPQHSSALPKLSNVANLTTGAAARVLAGFVLMPVTVIKVRYESSLYAYKSLGGATAAVVREGGVRGLFAGFGATAARDAPYAGLFVLFYERMKSGLSAAATAPGGGAIPAAAVNMASSVGAAGLATAITNPFDAIKTRVQLMPREYRNMVVAGRRMLREEGVKSFLDGLGLRMARKAMSAALAWTLYEELIRQAELRVVGEQVHVG